MSHSGKVNNLFQAWSLFGYHFTQTIASYVPFPDNCNQIVSESCFGSSTGDNDPKRDLNECRMNKLTASTFAGAIGFWPGRRTQLWLEKIGTIEPFCGNSATRWSNINEEEALERYKLTTGNNVLISEFQVYGVKDLKDNWLAASAHGVVNVCGLPSPGVLEIKYPFFNGDMEKASPWSRIPLHCIPRAQGLMEIMDMEWMDFYVWTPKEAVYSNYTEISNIGKF